MKASILLFIVPAVFIVTAGCSSKPKEFTKQKLVIASKKTVKIKELDLSITNKGCGRRWEGGGERAFCDLVITKNDSVITAGSDFDPIYIGNVKIQLDKINPWGREEDSVPPGGCRVIISKLPDTNR